MKIEKRQRLHLRCLFLVWILAGCSTPSSREIIQATQDRSRARAAAYAADGFMLDHRSPEGRPYQPWEFYYKHCTLVSRNPYPSRAEHSCSDPF